MFTTAALVFSIVLQIIAFASALWLLRYAKSRIAWILIAVALVFMAVRRVFDILHYRHTEVSPAALTFYNWLGIAVSVILAIAVILIARILYNLFIAERNREETEKRFATLFHNSSDEIFLADTRGNFIEVNKMACESLGYSPEEFRKLNFRDIKTPKYADTVGNNIQRILTEGTHTYETEHLSKEGKLVSLEVKSKLIDYQGEKAILSIARDISERKQLERKILRAIIDAEERERERIAREIHDDLGPLLSTIKLYVNELASDDMSTEERNEFFKRSNEILDEAIVETRTIANVLTPQIIIDFGLVRAVDSFCKKINLSQKISINYSSSVSERFDQTVELVLYRVVTELINNSLKHARASAIQISFEKNGNELRLTYMDDGVGFDLEKVLGREGGGMGLKNIISRLQSINGTYRIQTREGSGTTVIAEVKLDRIYSKLG